MIMFHTRVVDNQHMVIKEQLNTIIIFLQNYKIGVYIIYVCVIASMDFQFFKSMIWNFLII